MNNVFGERLQKYFLISQQSNVVAVCVTLWNGRGTGRRKTSEGDLTADGYEEVKGTSSFSLMMTHREALEEQNVLQQSLIILA